ncbi:extracellular solute-binding protein [Alphaproteobacteria bacterium]|nr:extracellular solute-binding protein [Alphaproteobacteria bacterium]
MIIFIPHKIAKYFLFFTCLFSMTAVAQGKSYYVSLRGMGQPKYKKEFTHFSYANPKAPKGGQINLSTSRRLDQLNPYVSLGGDSIQTENVFATLMKAPRDNIEVAYPYLAESVSVDPNGKFVTFFLRKGASFHSGEPITAQDVAFSFHLLKRQGSPQFQSMYQGVKSVQVLTPYVVKFYFQKKNRDFPYMLGALPILSQKSLEGKNFKSESLSLVGSGPYKVESHTRGKSISYSRIHHWWGEDLPCNKGFHNFDMIKIVWYANSRVGFEAFKRGLVDWWKEERIGNWYMGYDFPAFRQGNVEKKTYTKPFYHGLTGLFINTRRPNLSDWRVRKALNILFNFKWLNKVRFFDSYKRNKSIFMNSGYGSFSSMGAAERDLCRQYEPSLLPQGIFEDPSLEEDTSKGLSRHHFQKALSLFKEAGWDLEKGQLVHSETKKEMTIDLLVYAPGHVSIFQDFLQNLKRVGIKGRIRGVDLSYYMSCLRKRDFDIVLHFHPHVIIPGAEQEVFWSSKWANSSSGLNLSGVKNPIVDDLVEKIKTTESLKHLKTYTALLDRIIRLEYYLVPSWTPQKSYVAYWKKLSVVQKDASLYSPDTWWIKALEKEKN